MIGPTGVGKTEIARRLARLANAPFIKIEATKFTEVGYVGRDVDTIIRDLAETAIKTGREQAMRRVEARAADAAEDRILDILLPTARGESPVGADETPPKTGEESSTRQKFRKRLREGNLNDKEIEVEVASTLASMEIFCATRNGRPDPTNPGNVSEHGKRQAPATQDENRRRAESLDRRGSWPTDQ